MSREPSPIHSPTPSSTSRDPSPPDTIPAESAVAVRVWEEARLMRRMVLLIALGFAPLAAAADSPPLTCDDIVHRAAADPARLARAASLARWERELAATGR